MSSGASKVEKLPPPPLHPFLRSHFVTASPQARYSRRVRAYREHVQCRHAGIGIDHDQLLLRPPDELDQQRLRFPELVLVEDALQRWHVKIEINTRLWRSP